VRAQLVLAQQNRQELALLTALGVITNTIILPIGIALTLAFVGLSKPIAEREMSPLRRLGPWLALGAVIWLNLALMGQAAVNASTVTRFHYGAYITAQARQQLGAPAAGMLTKNEYSDEHFVGLPKAVFGAAYGAPGLVALFAAIGGLLSLRGPASDPQMYPGLRTAWVAVLLVTLLAMAVSVSQAYIAATSVSR
jgi:hypothetical protein